MSPVRPNGGESLQDMIDRYNRELMEMSAAGGEPTASGMQPPRKPPSPPQPPRPEPREPLYEPGGMLPRPEPSEPIDPPSPDARRHGLSDREQGNADRAQGLRDIEQARTDRAQGLRDMEQARTDRTQGLRDIEQARTDRAQGLRDMQQGHADRAQGLRDMQQPETWGISSPRMTEAPTDWEQWLRDLEQGRQDLEAGLRELEEGLREWREGLELYRRYRLGAEAEGQRPPAYILPWPEDDYPEGDTLSGYLTVQVFTAEGAEPVAGARVKVDPPAGMPSGGEWSDVTDLSGKTRAFALPVPAQSRPLTGYGAPSAQYRVYVSAEGFMPAGPLPAQIFGGIAGVLPVELIPRREGVR